jgi:DNA-binding MarR family transcriptional regulator
MSRGGGDGLETRQAPALAASSPPPPTLTGRQAEVLAVIVRFQESTGDQCRVSYLARRLKLTRAGVQAHVDALCRKGWLRSQDSPLRLRRQA